MRDFMQIARVALRDRPQLLQMLGANALTVRPAARPSAGTVASVGASVVENAAPLSNGRPLTGDQAAHTAASRRNGTKLAAVSE
jgi:hypothetical protein